MREETITHVSISRDKGFDADNLDFLANVPEVRGVWLSNVDNVDISGLGAIADSLECLSISDNQMPLDLAPFRRLRELRVEWHPKLRLSSDCESLRVLYLRRYTSKSKDLTDLPELPRLRELSVVQSPLNSIRGCGHFTLLERLELSYLSKLESIEAIRELSGGQLERLECEVCRKLGDHEMVRYIRSLLILRFNDCGQITDLRFLDEMPHLKEFYFVGTDVIDGDLTPLLRLAATGFTAKKHFSHKPAEMDALLAR